MRRQTARLHAVTAADAVLLAAAGVVTGAINAVAGGGSLVSFPALLAAGYTPLTANVTNLVATLPGYLSAAASSRPDLVGQGPRVRTLSAAAAVGAAVGTTLLLLGPEDLFAALAPWLVLLACALLALQPFAARWVGRAHAHPAPARLVLTVGVASIYGGYFGAGLGIVLLAAMGLALDEDLRLLNAVKQVLSLTVASVSAVAVALFGPVGVGRGADRRRRHAGGRARRRRGRPAAAGGGAARRGHRARRDGGRGAAAALSAVGGRGVKADAHPAEHERGDDEREHPAAGGGGGLAANRRPATTPARRTSQSPAPVQRVGLRGRRVAVVGAQRPVRAHERHVDLRQRAVERAQVAGVDVVGAEPRLPHEAHDVGDRRRRRPAGRTTPPAGRRRSRPASARARQHLQLGALDVDLDDERPAQAASRTRSSIRTTGTVRRVAGSPPGSRSPSTDEQAGTRCTAISIAPGCGPPAASA